MLKGKFVYLRLFEPGDYEKTYLWHSDFELMKSTCGPLRIVSKEIEKSWVQSKSCSNKNELYLAICLCSNDEMVGWYSISGIDYVNRSCECSGVLIGDKEYQDGEAYMEAGGLAIGYAFSELNMRRLTGACLREQFMSRAGFEASNWKLEGIARQALYKNGKYHDICYYSLLIEEWKEHMEGKKFSNYVRAIVNKSRELKRSEKDYLDMLKNEPS